MANNNLVFEERSFRSFLTKYEVVIPMVQRDYAQGRKTDDVNRVRTRFLNAIKKHLEPSAAVMKMDFVYGECTVVKNEDGEVVKRIITPLDGQQRLTTLYLLHWFATQKEGISEKEAAFLKHFTYDIRPSSRDFCQHLMDFKPQTDRPISQQIVDQYWFMAEWNNDPTITSMLVMLDAIKEHFEDIPNLWKLLTDENNKRIIFYFLPLKDNGLSDELYIKMNSRGKKLTPFEHFKAEYESIYERDSDESNEINHKFDVEWIDIFFPYRNEDDTVDKEFMRYFFYISHILCYQQSIKKSNDEFELIKLLYSDKDDEGNRNPHAEENRDYIKNSLDCWYHMTKNGGIDSFFDRYLSCDTYERGKVATYKTIEEYRNKDGKCVQNYFKACIKLYQVNNYFSNSDFLFLYGIITYLMNQDKIEESRFVERLRVLRNLIMNSYAGEIRAEAMGKLLDDVNALMTKGLEQMPESLTFNGIQVEEERRKLQKREELSPDDVERMYKFEDNPLIFGYVSGLGLEHLDLVDSFCNLFSDADYKLIHRALISVGDYTQKKGDHYYMGNRNRSTWIDLFHGRSREYFSESMEVLRELLRRMKDKNLQDIIDEFIKSQEDKGTYSWRYYFAKYDSMLRGSEGELVWLDSDYSVTTLNKHQWNGQHWDSFLNVICDEITGKYDKDAVRLGNYGENLSIQNPLSSLSSIPNGFTYYCGSESEDWLVSQNEDGEDMEDRVQMAIDKIAHIIK